jgi:hypothetical protein
VWRRAVSRVSPCVRRRGYRVSDFVCCGRLWQAGSLGFDLHVVPGHHLHGHEQQLRPHARLPGTPRHSTGPLGEEEEDDVDEKEEEDDDDGGDVEEEEEDDDDEEEDDDYDDDDANDDDAPQGFNAPCCYALITSFFTDKSRSSANGIYSMGTYLGSGLSSLSIMMAYNVGWSVKYTPPGHIRAVYAPPSHSRAICMHSPPRSHQISDKEPPGVHRYPSPLDERA